MILTDQHKRVVFWGCEITGKTLTAELGYFGNNLFTEIQALSNKDNSVSVKIKLPQGAIAQDFPTKAHNLVLEILQ